VAVTTERTRLLPITLSQTGRNGEGEDGGREAPLSATLNLPNPEKIDHLVLVLSNCGVKSSTKFFNDHDDDKGYLISVSTT
jgi:hypothetical protein